MQGPDAATIQKLFNTIAPKYDRFNQIASLWRDQYWRRRATEYILSGQRVLDLGTGTGDLAFEASKKVGDNGKVVAIDFSQDMLNYAAEKNKQRGINNIDWHCLSAEEVPFESAKYNWVVSGFVLRNIYENIRSIVKGVYDSLEDGGGISFVDLTEPENALIRLGSRMYMSTVIQTVGRACFRDDFPATYLQDSMKRFFRAKQFCGILKDAGFTDINAKPYFLGVVTHYTAFKRVG